MTPQERDLITQLLGRLAQAGGQPKDPEADQLIRQAVAAQPDAPYYLVQTVLIQDMALNTAQGRIAELERQLAGAKPAQPRSFLGNLFGRGASDPGNATGTPPSSGPWSRPAAAPSQAPSYQQPPYQPQYQPPPYQQPQAQPWGQPMMGSGGSGFLRSAAATAAGIAGGALLFEGIQSMFGHQYGGMLGGAGYQPGISETVINNYYGSDPAAQADISTADYSSGRPGADHAANPDPVDDQDFAANQDFSDDSDLA